jgi:hypothetical protein
MKKSIQLSLVSLALLAGTAAQAATTGSASFSEVANQNFTKHFTVTPTVTNLLTLKVSSGSAQLVGLTFSILGGPTVAATLTGGNWVAAFSDLGNNAYSFAAGSPLAVTVTGHTGNNAVISLSTRNGTIVSSVPEPETFAMLLAGLGLMGAIAARRKKTTV